jgi:hypothetical protein
MIKNINVTNLDTWKAAYPPKSDVQWRDGRSAKELARFLINDNPKMPSALVNAISDLTKSDLFVGEGEFVTNFSKYNFGDGEGRNHDFLMKSDDLLVAIESKVDEPFDELFKNKIKDSNNQKRRYYGLASMLFGSNHDLTNDLMYQLISASCGTLLEAKSNGLLTALLLIIVFKKPGCFNEKRIDYNEKAFNHFLSKLSTNSDGLAKTVFGTENNIKFYIRKIEIDIKPREE